MVTEVRPKLAIDERFVELTNKIFSTHFASKGYDIRLSNELAGLYRFAYADPTDETQGLHEFHQISWHSIPTQLD